MLAPDAIADMAILTPPTRDEAMLMLWRFQAERAEQQDNKSDQDWHRVNNVVRGEMGHD